MTESGRIKERPPRQEIPLTPLGIILASNRLIALKPLLELDQPPPPRNLKLLNESERALFENFPRSHLLTVITEDGIELRYAETTVTLHGIMLARERIYIGSPTLPEDQPDASFELFGQTTDVDGKTLPVEIALKRYPRVERNTHGYFVQKEKISFIDGNLVQNGYNPHYETHGLTDEYAKKFAEKMGIPPQTSMW